MPSLQTIATIVLIGAGATAIMDVWLMFLKLVGVPTGSFALIGRWVGHFTRGKFAHAAIAKSKPIHGELALGWLTHYATGVAYAALLCLAWACISPPLPSLGHRDEKDSESVADVKTARMFGRHFARRLLRVGAAPTGQTCSTIESSP